MADVTGRVASGELDLNLPESKRSDEVGRLAQAFSRMTVDLKRYIQELTVATAEKQRIESELSIAAEIQRNLLPTEFPTSSGSENLDVFAMMEPARHVGGDFYDFFPVGDRLFYFSIGDVCGKGIPAALLMARTKSLLESIVGENTDPAHLLARVNDRLAERNDQCVFVTLFLGILDLSNGELVYGNAGHEAPIFFRQDDEAAVLDQPHGPALGLFPGEQFPTSKITMKPGDVLFTFTDGITEALDKEGSLFSKERLLEEVKHLRRPKVDDLVNGVYRAVKSFARGTDQADDITLLALKLAGKRSPGQA